MSQLLEKNIITLLEKKEEKGMFFATKWAQFENTVHWTCAMIKGADEWPDDAWRLRVKPMGTTTAPSPTLPASWLAK